MKQKQKLSASSIVFYVIAVLLLFVFAFQVYYSYDYIGGYELDFSAEWKAILSIYFGQCVLPFIGAIVAYGIGLILAKLPAFEVIAVADEKEEQADEAMEDLVNSLKDAKTTENKSKSRDEEAVEDNNAEEEMPKDVIEG